MQWMKVALFPRLSPQSLLLAVWKAGKRQTIGVLIVCVAAYLSCAWRVQQPPLTSKTCDVACGRSLLPFWARATLGHPFYQPYISIQWEDFLIWKQSDFRWGATSTLHSSPMHHPSKVAMSEDIVKDGCLSRRMAWRGSGSVLCLLSSQN